MIKLVAPIIGCLVLLTTAPALARKAPPIYLGAPEEPNLEEKMTGQWFNEGFEGVVTQQDWDRHSIRDDTPPTVDVTTLGVEMVGFHMTTIGGRLIDAFQGIRYGASTEGANRFQYSKGAGNYWGDEPSITTDYLGPKCIQMSVLGNFGAGSEDCLFLNVYVPQRDDTTKPLPVMMFIHGGSFTSGDASLYMPTRLLDKDVILVVIQYRLGALGWLSLQNDNIPGNAGLSDQILAIEWVHEHIASFGGDQDLITIFGQSAGSTSVSMIQTINNDRTKGKFSGMIAESGSSLEYWAIDSNPLTSAVIYGEVCGCLEPSTMHDCLMGKEAGQLAVCTHDMVNQRRMQGFMGFEGTAPVVQREEVSVPLITKMPAEYIAAGESANVPILMGANRDEGSFVFGVMYTAYLLPLGLVNDSQYLENDAFPDVLRAFGIEDQTRSLSNSLQEKYLPGVDYSDFESICPGMIDMTGVFFIKGGTYQVALQQSSSLDFTSDAFFYSFDFVSENSIFDFFFLEDANIPFDAGVTHADEMMYIFSLPSELTDKQRLTSHRLVSLWTNFAKYRNPTPSEDSENLASLDIPTWPALTPTGLDYILIQDDLTIEQNFPDRWTIEMQLAGGGGGGEVTDGGNNNNIDDAEYDDLVKERNAYMTSMIVFVVLFVIAAGVGGYLWFTNR